MELKGKLSAVSTLSASLSASAGFNCALSSDIYLKLQSKTITPTDEEQRIVADDGYAGLSAVTIGAIPSNYGRVIYNGILTIV